LGLFEQFKTALFCDARPQADAIVVVGREAGEAVVLQHQGMLTRLDVDAVDVVTLGVSAIEPDEHVRRELLADCLDAGLHARQRRQVLRRSRLQVLAVDAPILVPVLVLQVENVPVRVGPEVHANAAVFVVRDGLGGREVAGGTHPDVQHAVHGR